MKKCTTTVRALTKRMTGLEKRIEQLEAVIGRKVIAVMAKGKQ